MVTHMEVSHGVQWTTERRAVGTDCPSSAAPQAESARRSTSGRSAPLLRRHHVDLVDRCTLEGVAAEVRQFDDLLATAASVGRGWHLAGAVAGLSGGVE